MSDITLQLLIFVLGQIVVGAAIWGGIRADLKNIHASIKGVHARIDRVEVRVDTHINTHMEHSA